MADEDLTAEAYRRIVRRLLHSEAGQRVVADAIVAEPKILQETLRIAAGAYEPKQEAAPIPPLDVKILAFIQAMTPEEQKAFADTGKMPEKFLTAGEFAKQHGRR